MMRRVIAFILPWYRRKTGTRKVLLTCSCGDRTMDESFWEVTVTYKLAGESHDHTLRVLTLASTLQEAVTKVGDYFRQQCGGIVDVRMQDVIASPIERIVG